MPMLSPADTVRLYWKLWAARDKPRCLELIDKDIVYALYVPGEVLPFGGETSGKGAASDRLQTILNCFQTVTFEGDVTRAAGDQVHGLVRYCFRHKATGEEIDGTMRQVATVRNGLIARWEEYTDVERVRAFMRLVAYTAAR